MLENIGVLVHEKRKELGLTIETLSEKANVSVSLISKIERGDLNNISVKKLNDIAASLNLTLSDFFVDPALSDIETLELIKFLKKVPRSKRKLISDYVVKLLML
jgi:transcriptional regulator with XRE-family HTH domain